MKIDAATRLYCIFGNPVTHSLSPAMHNAAFSQAGINAAYLAFQPESIQKAVDAMRCLGIRGASVTIPFKIDVMALCDSIDHLARKIGSVNTLLNDNGIIHGFNTDGIGISETFKEAGVDVNAARVLVLGNGGSARAAGFTLAAGGADIVIAGRNPDRVRPLADDIRATGAAVEDAVIAELDNGYMEKVDIILNTTPVGMHPDTGNTPLHRELLMPHHAVLDIVYVPRETTLLRHAREKGCTVLTGDNMLLHQACRQFTIWTGLDAPVAAMREALMAGIS